MSWLCALSYWVLPLWALPILLFFASELPQLHRRRSGCARVRDKLQDLLLQLLEVLLHVHRCVLARQRVHDADQDGLAVRV